VPSGWLWSTCRQSFPPISDRGIVLAGGGALLRNLDKRIRKETGVSVSTADDPLHSVVLGTGRILNNFKLLERISIE
jgi:rod shape-determining protein MreB and related proteins